MAMEQKKGRPQQIELRLSRVKRERLEKLLRNGGRQNHRTCQRARVLLSLRDGKGVTAVSREVGVSVGTVQNIRKRYLEEGLEQALNDKPRSGQPMKLSPEVQQRIIAIACTDPPAGHSHWSLRLLAHEVKRQKLADPVSYNTIRVVLQSHDLKPWREKNVVRRQT
jgi:putative transposase